MTCIGITGQAGFIGTHLYNYLLLEKDKYTLVPFSDSFYEDELLLTQWTSKTDTIIHLAGVNRHKDQDELYKINVSLVSKLIQAVEKTKRTQHIIFSSSTQEEIDNLYGKSKKQGRKLFTEWAERNKTIFTGLIIPNVFGPFGRPYYNSVIATFCHQLTHKEQPRVENDSLLKLIYIGELVSEICKVIDQQIISHEYHVTPTCKIKVTEVLALLQNYRKLYFEKFTFPTLHSTFEVNLFNTFRSFIEIKDNFPNQLIENTDQRGTFVETIKTELGGQISFSTTNPGITRGNHFHIRKIERFIVVKGEALIQLRRIGTDEVFDLRLSGSKPSYVDMPVWYTHNITNIGGEELLTIFWINEFYDANDPDTYFENV